MNQTGSHHASYGINMMIVSEIKRHHQQGYKLTIKFSINLSFRPELLPTLTHLCLKLGEQPWKGAERSNPQYQAAIVHYRLILQSNNHGACRVKVVCNGSTQSYTPSFLFIISTIIMISSSHHHHHHQNASGLIFSLLSVRPATTVIDFIVSVLSCISQP